MLHLHPRPGHKSKSKINVRHLTQKFAEEMTEALIIVIVIHVVADKPMDPWRILRISTTLAIITTGIELYSPTLAEKIKEGVRFTAGASIVS